MTKLEPHPPLTRDALLKEWREREAYHKQCELPGAGIYRKCIGDLEQLWQDEAATWLSAPDAAHSTGYSEDHLRRLARENRVVAEKRGRAWWYLAGSLKIRSQRPRSAGFDPDEAARETLRRLNKTNSN